MIVSQTMYRAECDECRRYAWDFDMDTWHESAEAALAFALTPGIHVGLAKVGDRVLCKKCCNKSLAKAISEFAEEQVKILASGMDSFRRMG